MVELAARSKVDVGERMLCVRDPHELADVMHDRLVDVWHQPLQESDDQCETLRQKADLWERHRRSVPPKSTQHVRTPTTRASPVAPKHLQVRSRSLPRDPPRLRDFAGTIPVATDLPPRIGLMSTLSADAKDVLRQGEASDVNRTAIR